MKLERLQLQNFRGFESLDITFDPSFTVILGANMSGKSALLDAAAVALAMLLSEAPGATQLDLDDSRVRRIVETIDGIPDLRPQQPVFVGADVSDFGNPPTTRIELQRSSMNPIASMVESRMNAPDYRSGMYPTIGNWLRSKPPRDLPVIAHYSAHRAWAREPISDDRGIGSRADGYRDWFEIASPYGSFASWMRKQTLVELQRGNGYVQPQLAAVIASVKACVNDVLKIWFDVQYEEIRVERTPGEICSFSMLSEGYRNVIAMVADIAHRAAVLNPQHGSAAGLKSSGVVLVDELDLHLHPRWQRRIVEDLRRAFPNIQFIVTTHSPQVVASVQRAQVRVLDNNRIVASDSFVEGRDTNALLEDIFGVPARPPDTQLEIDELFRLIDKEDFARARERLETLEARLSQNDVDMARARWLLDVEDPQSTPQVAALP